MSQTFPAHWADGTTQTQDLVVYPGLDGRVRYQEAVFIGYRHADRIGVAPLFPFGFGLSHTRFEISNLTVDGMDVAVTAPNGGARSGSTVVQIYVAQTVAAVPRPSRALKAFTKVTLAACTQTRVVLALTRVTSRGSAQSGGFGLFRPGTMMSRWRTLRQIYR